MMMRSIFLSFFLVLSSFGLSAQEAAGQTISLRPNESMCITGKGKGQDAAINPYIKEESIAQVSNLGLETFEIRLQKGGEILEIIPLKADEIKELKLAAGVELYFDSPRGGKANILFRASE